MTNRKFTFSTAACCLATFAALALAPIAAADPDEPSVPEQPIHAPAQGSMELPTDRGRHHVLLQDQNSGGANPDVPYGTDPYVPDHADDIGGADPSTPDGTDPDVPFGTWAGD
ncbi:hypothetical protein FZI91_20450 [Mycobacterium sp. CBMA271]|uniref:hypothetical protein n=1 Tax=unclassified Mycobacteroides TaxID=2618759 RepID=UPI0012DD34C5|nr:MULTISPECIES: hypothetical protein [unclassified Mycobacteroides]MUM16952.1 hypothetical protein [Mycobacteroides sp. CBMA 326]MUM24059.1 hypothetical protein [Mycobacteroides sp. CBMA 271]